MDDEAFLGFSYHFRVERSPSWSFMATNCRDTCGLTGREETAEDAVYVTPYASDVMSKSFCDTYANRCPSVLSGDPAEQGAQLFGADTSDKTTVLCDPYAGEFAYYDEVDDTYLCCSGYMPTIWDR